MSWGQWTWASCPTRSRSLRRGFLACTISIFVNPSITSIRNKASTLSFFLFQFKDYFCCLDFQRLLPCMVWVPVVVCQPNVHERSVVTKSQQPGYQMTIRKYSIISKTAWISRDASPIKKKSLQSEYNINNLTPSPWRMSIIPAIPAYLPGGRKKVWTIGSNERWSLHWGLN